MNTIAVIVDNREWYEALINDCRIILIKRFYNSNLEAITCYGEIGQRIFEDKSYNKHGKGNQQFNTKLFTDIGIGRETGYKCLRFYEKEIKPGLRDGLDVCNVLQTKYPKDITWRKIVNDYLPTSDIEPVKGCLRDKYIVPPFSVLDSKQGDWQDRKREWLALGIKSEVGRSSRAYTNPDFVKNIWGKDVNEAEGVSVFDPVLAEIMYRWFCPAGGNILDPLAGGSVRGIVANHLGYKYYGIELRQEQVDCNRDQAQNILSIDNQPQWFLGDADKILDSDWQIKFDFIFSCPPYMNLEKYSNLPDDLSNLPDDQFIDKYQSIIKKSCALLKPGCFACFVVSEVRDRDGYYMRFKSITEDAFCKADLKFYNDAVLLNRIGSACLLAPKQFEAGRKLVRVHQNVLIFKKLRG